MSTSKSMRAVGVIPQKRQVGILSHAAPKITSPKHVQVRTIEVGICGTDREISDFDYGTPPCGSDYLVLGHEALGEVVEVGPEVSEFRPGDLVVPTVRRPCPIMAVLHARKIGRISASRAISPNVGSK